MGKRWIVILVVAGMALVGAAVYGEEEGFAVSSGEGATRFTGSYSGRKTWTIGFGFGDALALAYAGLSSGSISLEQTLAVDIEATALGVLRVEAHFDDQEDESLQSLSIYLDTERLDGVAGDFIVPDMGSFSTYSRKLKGARLDYHWGIATITGIASKLEGVTESKTFTGETAELYVVFRRADPDSGEAASYLENLEGLASFPLVSLYVEEFADVRMILDLSSGLRSLLAEYGVSELADALEGYEGKDLLTSEFSVIGDDPEYLVLRAAPVTILRRTIKEAIEAYNDEVDGEMVYPFSSGSDAETQFLAEVLAYASIAVHGDRYGVRDAERSLHFDLGETDAIAESLEIEIDPDGSGYRWISEATWPDYGVLVYEEEGILEIRLPEETVTHPDAALRVTVSYEVTGGAYSLGFSVVPGTERITRNSVLLVRDIDYSIDYEIGYVVLFTEIGATDELTIEYERYGSGSVDYARYFSGVTVDIPLPGFALDLYLLQASDDSGSIDDRESVSTMPNRQVVAGASGVLELPDTTAKFDVGYVNDRYPYDDNQRTPLRNRVNALASGFGFVLVGHDAGFSVLSDGEWQAYDSGDGLAGRSVRAIALSDAYAFLGTNGGLSVVALDGISPFDHASGWTEFYDSDGLPDSSVRALLLDGGTLYAGTDAGVASVAVTQIEDAKAWARLIGDEYGAVTALALSGTLLYVGTESGLITYDRVTHATAVVAGTSGVATHALHVEEDAVYAASASGLCSYVDGVEVGWIVRGVAVYAVASRDGDLYYGTANGMVRVSDGTAWHAGWVVSAMASAEDGVWAGSEANGGYELWVWRLADGEVAYDADTMEVSGANPYKYEDTPSDEHMATGWVVSGSFDHSSDGFSLSGTVDRVQEGYRSIGERSRSDGGGWTLDGSIALGPSAKLELAHSYEMSDLTTSQRVATLENDLSFTGRFGPTIVVRLHQESEDASRSVHGAETDQVSYSLSVDDKLFADTVRATIDWKESFLWEEGSAPSRSAVLASGASWSFVPGWTSTFSWRRPVYVSGDQWSGSERFTWGVDGAATFAGVQVLSEYDGRRTRSLPNGTATFDHTGRVRLAVSPFTWQGGKMTPNLDLSGEWDDGEVSLTGKLNLRSVWASLSGRTALTVGVTGLGESVERWSEKVTSTWSYTGIASLRPTLTYSASRATATYGDGTDETTSHSLSGRATWSSPRGDSDTVAATVRWQSGDETDVSVSLENSYQRDITPWISSLASPQSASQVAVPSPYPMVTVGSDVAADWDYEDEASDARWTVSGDTTVVLSTMWSASLSVVYSGGWTESGTWYHGAWFALTVAIDF
ncbi:MAG: hypothetical protein PHX77_00325 [Candidatus Bipolaricaulis sp.]|nr:hypothetical protein [Candidatus Bipolaricaulis sp.]